MGFNTTRLQVAKGFVLFFLAFSSTQSWAFYQILGNQGGKAHSGSFPMGPDLKLTPGSLCNRPTQVRYPERINYCERDVESRLKWEIIRVYNVQLGYDIKDSDRGQYKIDHFIPLCMGGSNNPNNLWPQHVSIYQQTDPLEPVLCDKMKFGRLRQRDAIEMIMTAKRDLSKIRAIMARAQAL